MTFRLFSSAVALVWLSSSAYAGYIEICKDAAPGGSLSGVFDFSIAGQSGTFSTPVGACTADFQLPDGTASITELPPADTTFVGVSSFPDDRLISFDAVTETAVVLIVPGDISAETVVTFTDAPGAGVPEPGTAGLLGLGLILWAVCRRARQEPDPKGMPGPMNLKSAGLGSGSWRAWRESVLESRTERSLAKAPSSQR